MFNLNKNQKYKKIQNEKSIFCQNNNGPWIPYFGFYQSNQMRKIKHRSSSINSSYENGAEILPNNSTTTKYFEVKEVEIYKIIL